MGNTMSKMTECEHQIKRKSLKNDMSYVCQKQKEIEERVATVDKSLEETDDFIKDCEENEIPKSILRALYRGNYFFGLMNATI